MKLINTNDIKRKNINKDNELFFVKNDNLIRVYSVDIMSDDVILNYYDNENHRYTSKLMQDGDYLLSK